ncbi:MAG: hypothetical protein ACFFCS_21910 [Candidatus Hodarchaeota archaeon]
MIPDGDPIIYCTMCAAIKRESSYTGTGIRVSTKKWFSPVIFTSQGVAFKGDHRIKFLPWYDVKWMALGRFQVDKIDFKLVRVPEYESEDTFNARSKIFSSKFKPLMNKRKREANVSNRGVHALLGFLITAILSYPLVILLDGRPITDVTRFFYLVGQGYFLVFWGIFIFIGTCISFSAVSRRNYRKHQEYEASKKSHAICENCWEKLELDAEYCNDCGTRIQKIP